MGTVGTIDILMRAQTEQASGKIAKLGSEVGQFGASVNTTLGRAMDSFAKLGASKLGLPGLSGNLLLDGLNLANTAWAKIEQSAEKAKERMLDAGRAAKTLGIGVNDAAKLLYAGRFSGMSAEQTTHSAYKVQEAIGAAAEGDAGKAGAFAKLGLDPQKLRAESVVQAMEQISTAFAELPRGADRARVAHELFGKQALEMVPLLSGLHDKMERLGATIAIDPEGVARLQAYNRALADSREIIDNLTKNVDHWWNHPTASIGATLGGFGSASKFEEAKNVTMVFFTQGQAAAQKLADAYRTAGQTPLVDESELKKAADAAEALKKIADAAAEAANLMKDLQGREDAWTPGVKEGKQIHEIAEKMRAGGASKPEVDKFIAEAFAQLNKLSDHDWAEKGKKDWDNLIGPAAAYANRLKEIQDLLAHHAWTPKQAEEGRRRADEDRWKPEADRKYEQETAEADRLRESTKSPLERYRDELRRISDLLSNNRISPEIAGRAGLLARDRLLSEGQQQHFGLAPGGVAGSAGAYAAGMQAQFGKRADTQEKILAEAQKQTVGLDNLAKAMGDVAQELRQKNTADAPP